MKNSKILLLSLGFAIAPGAGAPSKEQIIYDMGCAPDASTPYAGPVIDSTGTLYGTSLAGGFENGGSVYRLSPPAGGSTVWTEQVLFSSENYPSVIGPRASLLLSATGNLFGTGSVGATGNCAPEAQGCGGVFEVSPPSQSGGLWTGKVIYKFSGSDGGVPAGLLAENKKGHLFGTTEYGGSANAGTVFELVPPVQSGGAWHEKILYDFQDTSDGAFPVSSLLMDKTGALYGQTQVSNDIGSGTVFKLTPPAGTGKPWTFSVLGSAGGDSGFQFSNGLVMDAKGILYGTTNGGGINASGFVFSLTPPPSGQGRWTTNVLYTFGNGNDSAFPSGAPFLYKGALYGVTEGTGNSGDYGRVYKLSPPKAGSATWSLKTLYSFPGGVGGAYGVGALVRDMEGNFYGATMSGGKFGCGTVFQVKP